MIYWFHKPQRAYLPSSLACAGVRLRTHVDAQQPGEDGSSEATEQLKEQLPHHQENPQTVDGGRQ